MSRRPPPLDPDLLLRAYAAGLFPMAEGREAGDVFWVEPRRRGIIPLDGFHLPRTLARTLKRERFRHSVDEAFEAVIDGCAAATPDRPDTWINPLVRDAYVALHARGAAHSVECWAGDELAGGLYGVRLGGAFFGESMFTRLTDASKCALAHLVVRLRVGGFRLLDTQFLTDHLARFGAVEVPRERYKGLLGSALGLSTDFGALDPLVEERLRLGDSEARGPGATLGPSGKLIVQLLTQTS